MSRIELLPASGGSYKANLHCHTTLSDGRLTPEEVKARYLSEGYSVVAFTDHNVLVDHSDLNDGHFLALTGIEVDTDSFLYGKGPTSPPACPGEPPTSTTSSARLRRAATPSSWS